MHCIILENLELLGFLAIARQARISLEPSHKLAALRERSSRGPSIHTHRQRIFFSFDKLVVFLFAQFQQRHDLPES